MSNKSWLWLWPPHLHSMAHSEKEQHSRTSWDGPREGRRGGNTHRFSVLLPRSDTCPLWTYLTGHSKSNGLSWVQHGGKVKSFHSKRWREKWDIRQTETHSAILMEFRWGPQINSPPRPCSKDCPSVPPLHFLPLFHASQAPAVFKESCKPLPHFLKVQQMPRWAFETIYWRLKNNKEIIKEKNERKQ